MNRLETPYLRLFVVFVALAVLAVSIAACGGDDGDSTTPTRAGNTAAISPTRAATEAASPATAATSAGASAAALIKVGNTPKGNVLTDSAGLSLYTFDNDATPGKSSCNGGCATTWPPLTMTAATAPSALAGATGTFSLISRDDGTKQIAYNGKPLYRYAPDKAPGDTNGDGVGNVWHLAKP